MKNMILGRHNGRSARAFLAFSILAVLVLLWLGACALTSSPSTEQAPKGPFVVLHTKKGNKIIEVEIADTPAEREVGLMRRKFLAKDAGMVFVFDDADTRNFWMKNTLIPLDMIFFGADYKVLNVAKMVLPCKADPCEVYSSMGPAKYVLEVNGGLSDEIGLDVGDKVEIKI